jgi:hypothetical protein
MKYRPGCFLLFFFISYRIFGGIGEINFISGGVEIVRDEEVLTEEDLFIGDEIENYDQIQTGSDGQLIIDLTSTRSADTEIHVSPNTLFVIDLNKVERKQTTTLNLITGSLGLKVQKLGGNQGFHVKTEKTAMGVRGTEFSVETSPAADVLVTCSEGSVVCRDEETGGEAEAMPGSVVEKRMDADIRSIPVAVSDLESYRRDWFAERIRAFKPNALRVIKFYARRYDELYNRFNAEYEALMMEMAILKKWIQEDREGRMGSKIQIMKEKKQIVGYIFRIREVFFIFERVYHRLLELYSYFQQGYGIGEIRPGLTTAEFYRRFMAQSKDLAQKARKVRYIMKLYAKRNEGNLPLSRF